MCRVRMIGGDFQTTHSQATNTLTDSTRTHATGRARGAAERVLLSAQVRLVPRLLRRERALARRRAQERDVRRRRHCTYIRASRLPRVLPRPRRRETARRGDGRGERAVVDPRWEAAAPHHVAIFSGGYAAENCSSPRGGRNASAGGGGAVNPGCAVGRARRDLGRASVAAGRRSVRGVLRRAARCELHVSQLL